MARRKELKGIARNFSELLNCRNNDYLGYWAVGQLYSLVQDSDSDSVTLDLVNFNNSLSNPAIDSMCQAMRTQLNRLLLAQKISRKWIEVVSVTFSFNQEYQKQYHYWRSALGEPYLIHLIIETDLGCVNSAVQGGNVKLHNSSKEQRRGDF